MSDKKPNLTRRKALLGLGGIGAGAALGGAGTMALFNDKETSKNNAVTAGKLDLKIDWWQRYYQGKKRGWDGSEQRLTNKPNKHGPIFEIYDAKPGDFGCGLISLHVFDNPAYVWAACDLKERENGIKDPEKKVDETRYKGELAKNIKVALLRYPIIEGGNAFAGDQTEFQNEMMAELEGDKDMESLHHGRRVFVTTLKDLCEKKLHHGHLLDGRPKKKGKCFKRSHTYFYGFCWWIPKEVGNEIQSDSVKFDLKFGAVQCRHVKRPEKHNPFKNNNMDSDASGDE